MKGRPMQMNVLRTKQVSHVGNRDDRGQPIACGDGQRCRRRVGSRDYIDWLAVGRQVFRSHLVQTSEHLDANSEPNPVQRRGAWARPQPTQASLRYAI